jgi:NDP-sugar pyrophosphorylase family protein
MYPLSKYKPKTMIRLHGKFLLEYLLDTLVEIGIDEFVVVIGYLGDKIRPLVGKYRQQDIKVNIVDQGEKLGIEGAILSAAEYFPEHESFLLTYGDILAPSMFFHHLINSYINSAADGAIAVTLVGKSSEFGIASIDDRGFITEILPETPANESDARYIYAGASILPTEFFEILREENKLTASLMRLLNEQRRICASIWQKEWIDVGYPWDLLAANQDLFKEIEYARIHKTVKVSPSAEVSGIAIIEENVVIDHNAKIKGPCFIGKNSYIGTNSLIREYACIEENCTIGFSVEVKNSVIQPGTKIGRLSFVGDSVLGEKVNLESGVTTMNLLESITPNEKVRIIKGRAYRKLGSVIGPNSIIGSNSVSIPGIIIDSDQIIAPGSVIRENIIINDNK